MSRHLKLTSAALTLLALTWGSPRPAHAQTFGLQPVLKLDTPTLIQAVAHKWPAAWSLLVRLDVVEPEALELWSQPRWDVPERATWTLIDGYPVVGTPQVDELTVTLEKPAHTQYWLRHRYQASRAELEEWNPELDLLDLEVGQEVVVWRRDPEAIARGQGSPNRGRLRDGEPLPLAEKYEVLRRHRAFGTYYAVSEIKRVFDAYAEAYPDAHPVMIGDLSFRRGRRIRPHVSHQSGRDVDITYPRLTPPAHYRHFQHISRRDLDPERTLWLVREFVSSGMVQYIFMDRWVQRLVYKEAERQGAPQEWLDAVFEYPGYGGRAIVRRSRGHDDHMHIRFWCQPTDRWCE